MKPKLYVDNDVKKDVIDGFTAVVIGYGTQGTARALNMRDSGLNVIIGADEHHEDRIRAEQDGFPIFSVEEAASKADIIELEIPDMAYRCAEAYNKRIKPNAKPYHIICLSSAMNYYYGHMDLPDSVDAVVTAAKGPGSAVRTEYTDGRGVPGLLAVHQDASGKAWDRGLAVCAAMGFTRAGVLRSTVEEETVTDLLGEHCAWGAIVMLLKTVYEVMVEEGYSPEVAFYEAVNESKLTTDLIYRFGITGMLERISNTAAFGAMSVGPKVIDEHVKENVRWAVQNIRDGGFDREWKRDFESGYTEYNRLLENIRKHQSEIVGNEIRIRQNRLKEDAFSIKNRLD